MGTSVKDLMKSSSSSAPALSLDTTKIEQGVNKHARAHTHTHQPVFPMGFTGTNVHVNHISLVAGISEDHTSYNCWRQIAGNVGVNKRILRGQHGEQEIPGINNDFQLLS